MTKSHPNQATHDWPEANKRFLMAHVRRVCDAVARHAGKDEESADHESPEEIRSKMTSPPALERLCQVFNLSLFERDLLLLAAGVELDSAFARLLSETQGSFHPTFSLAMAALPKPHWDAIAPSSPLRRWRLLDLASGSSLTNSHLQIDERILHYLAGVSYLDDRLWGTAEPLSGSLDLAPSHTSIADSLAEGLRNGEFKNRVLQLTGPSVWDHRSIAVHVANALSIRGISIQASDLPSSPTEREAYARLLERDAVLDPLITFIEIDEPPSRGTLTFLNQLQGLLILSTNEPLPKLRRPMHRVEIANPDKNEQRLIWKQLLGDHANGLNGSIDQLVAQFDLGLTNIVEVVNQVIPGSDPNDTGLLEKQLWQTSRLQCRQQLQDLAQRIEPRATWDDLVLPDNRIQTLREIASQVKHRTKVYEEWGFAKKSQRGLGISALFSGQSGTGKTMAAEVLANELQLDLYHIDLSQMVSKYIGETEKNLRKIFDAAEQSGAILLFDEADAIFGKRTEVKDSHDRYANIETSYLLQRMESYKGLSILTTNRKSALDDAFQRRIRFAIDFPFPDTASRTEIWGRIFPPDTPTNRLKMEGLARLNVSGGMIRNIALHSTFLAAEHNRPVGINDIQQAARSVYARLDKKMNETELRRWLQ